MLAYTGQKIRIDSVNQFVSDSSVAVYNIETSPNHNYFVSASKLLVHNCNKAVSEAVELNFKRFASKVPANAKSSIKRSILKDGTNLFEATSPARNIPGSYAKYQKYVDMNGKTIKYLKTTVGPDGKIIHTKIK